MAENGALVVSWSPIHPGVQMTQAMGVLAQSLGYYDELQKAGRITGYKVYGSMQGAHGMLIVEGDRHELAKISVETGSLQRLIVAQQVANMKVELFAGGTADDVTEYFMKGLQAVGEAGFTV